MAGCQTVVHFAAESHVDRSIYEPAPVIETNVTGTFVLLQIARKLNIDKFVHISTDEVYGDMAPGAFADENSPLQPSSPYSASKASSDLIVRSYVRTFAFPAVITRSSNNYGPYQFPEKFLPLMITNALDDKPLPIYGDGKQERDWLHVTGSLPRNSGGSGARTDRRGLQHRRPRRPRKSHHGAPSASRHGKNRIAAYLRERSPRPRSPLCPYLRQNRAGTRLETLHPSRRRFAPDD